MKVLVIGSAFREYTHFFGSAFTDLGYNTETYVSPMMGIKPQHIVTRIKRKMGFNVSEYYSKSRAEISMHARETFERFKPDLVFVMLGNMLTKEDIEYFTSKSITVLYLTDPLSRVPEIKECLRYYDHIYTYEKTEMQTIKELSGKMPGGMFGLFSNKAYYPISLPKDIDIYFVSALYPFRTEIMIKLMEDYPTLNIEADGNYTMFPESKKMIQSMPGSIRSKFSNKNISAKEINKKYNRSRIVLNLQHPQTKEGWNSRLTEILGAGAFEVVTYNNTVEKCFNGCLAMYSDYKGLKEKIDYYLAHEAERQTIAKKGHDLAIKKYTYTCAFEEMMREIM